VEGLEGYEIIYLEQELHDFVLHELQESSFVMPGDENREIIRFTLLLSHSGQCIFSSEISYL